MPVSLATVPTRTHCPYCAFQCGMTISPALEVRPDDTFPVNRGQMCTKGFTSADLLDHAERVTTPLLRGSDGQFAPSSWETALDFIAERLLAIRAAHGPEALAAFVSGAPTNENAYLLGKLARLAL